MSRKLTHEEFIARVIEKNDHVRNGEIEIRGVYIDANAPIECYCNNHDLIFYPIPFNLYKGQGCKKCKYDKISKAKRLSDDEFIQKVYEVHQNKVVPIGKYVNHCTDMDFQCDKGHVWIAPPNRILAGCGCPYCAGKKVLIGFNDLWTTHPEIAKLLKDPEDGYKYTYGSNKKVDFICKDCGNMINSKISNVYWQGLCCQMCSDGVSYPNKLIRQVLTQLEIDFIPEYCPEWSMSKQYDCYFNYNNQEYVIEMDGAQHYVEIAKFKTTLEEIKINDELKTLLALQNGVSIIRINCMESNLEYIKKNIFSSELNNIFDLSNICWETCDKNAQKSLVKEVCNLYMSGTRKIQDICDILHINRVTIGNYLKMGSKFGWCDYTSKTTKSVTVFDLNQHELHCFDGISECSRCMKDIYGTPFYKGYIRNSMNTNKPYKGFIFKLTNDNTKLMKGGVANGYNECV